MGFLKIIPRTSFKKLLLIITWLLLLFCLWYWLKPNKVDTTNWKTFNNGEISFRYPRKYSIQEMKHFGNDYIVSVGLPLNPDPANPVQGDTVLQILFDKPNNYENFPVCPLNLFADNHNCLNKPIRNINIGGRQAKDIYFQSYDSWHLIQMDNPPLEIFGGSDREFQTILSTFKFTDHVIDIALASARDKQRKADIEALFVSLKEYAADNQGKIPDGITKETQFIKTGQADICHDFVPKYFPIFPHDPSLKVDGIDNCNTVYDSGYTIIKDTRGQITISAPHAESEAISVTKDF